MLGNEKELEVGAWVTGFRNGRRISPTNRLTPKQAKLRPQERCSKARCMKEALLNSNTNLLKNAKILTAEADEGERKEEEKHEQQKSFSEMGKMS